MEPSDTTVEHCDTTVEQCHTPVEHYENTEDPCETIVEHCENTVEHVRHGGALSQHSGELTHATISPAKCTQATQILLQYSFNTSREIDDQLQERRPREQKTLPFYRLRSTVRSMIGDVHHQDWLPTISHMTPREAGLR